MVKLLRHYRKKGNHPITIKDLIRDQFIKSTLILIIIMEAITFVSFALLIENLEKQTSGFLEQQIQSNITLNASENAQSLDENFNDIEKITRIVQQNHVAFFEHYDEMPIVEHGSIYKVHPNGALYNTSEDGSAVYYAKTGLASPDAMTKVYKTAQFDTLYRSIISTFPAVEQIYFNSADGMTRIYPYISRLPELLGDDMIIENYNFYYLADAYHDPERKLVWTDVYLDPVGKGWMISCIVPIYVGDTLVGVSGLDMTVENLINDLLDIQTSLSSPVILTSASGVIMAMNSEAEAMLDVEELTSHAYKELVTGTVRKPADFNIFNHGDESFKAALRAFFNLKDEETQLTLNNHDYFITKNKIGNMGWQLLVFSDMDDMMAPVVTLAAMTHRIFVFIVLFVIVLNFVILRVITDRSEKVGHAVSLPLLVLKENIQKLSTDRNIIGAYENIGIEEIDILNFEFFMMHRTLKERTTKLIKTEQEKQEQYHEMERYLKKALTDELTGLMNRRAIEDYLDEIIEKREGQFAVIMLDIDHFKLVNDAFGHLIGDDVLIDFAKLLKKHVSTPMMAARWGGEEFIIALPSMNLDDAVAFAENLRTSIEAHSFSTGTRITASFGVAECHQESGNKRAILQRADIALYEAKSSGRNCVKYKRD